MGYARITLMGIVILSLPLYARAERPPQNRDEAPIALTGTVESISTSWDLSRFKVYVRVAQIDRGPTIQTGDLFEVSCFQTPRTQLNKPGARGHASIPVVGDKIHMFAWPRGSGHEGNYPVWYDLIEPSRRSRMARLFDDYKSRIAIVVGICVFGIVMWRLRKRAIAAERKRLMESMTS